MNHPVIATSMVFDPASDAFCRAIVSRKAKQLIRRTGFSASDLEDIKQDLYLRILQSWPKYEPEHSHRNRFITAVVERYVANLLRNRGAGKRDDRETSSLNLSLEPPSEGANELGETISERELDSRLGRKRRDHVELASLQSDVRQLLAELPEPWRAMLELRRTQTQTQISLQLGVSRATLRNWMQRIRQRFEEKGIRDYL
ncbi:MAG: RNA polymerase sigma factor [Planctomycetaceae bacterium]